MRRPATRSKQRNGALATELALVLPFVVFATLVIVDFCRVYHVTQTLTTASHVAAYHASGAGQAPAYRPPSGGLLPGVTEIVRPILGGQAVEQASASTTNAEVAARKAAIAECASLQPALREDQVTVSYQNGKAQVIVAYRAELITPIFGASRTVELSRTTTMAVVGVAP
jgi:hypothetical protein